MMRITKYLVPLWIGVLLYAGLSLLFGSKGLSAYSQLKAELEKETANVQSLKTINTDLINVRDMLLTDTSNFRVYARELGFAAPGEHFVRIIGLGGHPKAQVSPGEIVSPAVPESVPDLVIRVFSFFMAFTLFISMAVYDFLKMMKEKEAKTAGYRYPAV